MQMLAYINQPFGLSRKNLEEIASNNTSGLLIP